MTKIKRVLRRGLRLPARFLRKLDRIIQRSFTKLFRGLYKITFLRPAAKKIYPFVHYHHRITAAVLCIVIIAGVAVPILQPYLRSQRYKLNNQAQGLLGEADKDLTKKLTFDDTQQLFQFNKDAKKAPTTEGNPLEKLQSQVGGGGKEDNQLYSVDVPRDLLQGVTYYDNQMELNFKLTPQFSTMPGEQREGHLVYPLNGAKGQLAYTVDASGMKENVVLYQSPGNEFNMEYKLDLPESLEAKLIPETGEIGIYSADPALFGNITYGTSDDQAKVEKARNQSEKTYLTFKIPAPVVLGVGKMNQASIAAVDSYFELSGDTLRVVTKGLDKAEYPLSIDPSVTVDSNSDFQTGNMEDNNLSTSGGDLNRGTLTGGSLGNYQLDTLPYDIGYHSAVAYNGYMYIMGGWESDGGVLNNVQYAPINSDGSVGTWSATTRLPESWTDHTAVVYNGYLYVVGGYEDDTLTDSVVYAPINSDGSVGTWEYTTNLPSAREGHATVVYNGFMYVISGYDGSNYITDAQYAPINANGTLGAWQATNNTNMDDEKAGHTAAVYNGYIYIAGGDWTTDVQYAPINADGTLGAWVDTTGLTSVRYAHNMAVYNGYLYISGGSGDGGPGGSYGAFSSTQYAPINANGTLGAWQTTTALPSTRSHGAGVAYNGYFYNIGGDNDDVGSLDEIRYAAINPPGVTTAYNTTSTFSTGRLDHGVVAYNGYMYVLGGSGGGYRNDVQYAPINANGTLGTWQTTTSFTGGRAWLGATAYNGYMYISGGEIPYVRDVQYAPINANGTLGTWQYTTDMQANNSGHVMLAYNGYMYTTGGYTGGSIATVQYAPINANGTLGSWTYTTSFAGARYDHTSVTYNGYMYVIGGTADSNRVQYAPINANGTLGSWTYTTNLPAGRSNHSTVAYNGYMYVIGGSSTNTTYYAPINSDGTIGSWSSTSTLPAGRSGAGSVIYNGFVYVVGGSSSNTVYYAQINNGGSGIASSWTSTTGITAARSAHSSVAYNGFVYVIGGFGSGYQNTVYYAPLNSNGTIGSWGSANTFNTGRERLAAVAYNGYMYVLGGRKGSSSSACRSSGSAIYCNDVQYAPINSDGTLGSWSPTTSFTTPRYGHTAVAYNGYMYIFGGAETSGNLNTVYSAPINSDGTVGVWTARTSLPESRREHSSVLYNGYVYILGGASSGGGNKVYFAPLNSDGTVGVWIPTTSFNVERTSSAAVAYNGYLYVLGGYTATQANDVQYAPINSDGTIGNWLHTTGLTIARDSHTSVAYNGYLYVLGGYTTTQVNTTQYTTLSSISRKASYSKVIDLGTVSKVTDIDYTGTLPAGLRNIRYRVAGTNGVFGTIQSASPPLSCSGSIGQYVQVFITLDDSEVGGFPDDSNTNNAKLSSITVDSVPVGTPPDKRLRHGAWFSSDVLQPFDAGGEATGC